MINENRTTYPFQYFNSHMHPTQIRFKHVPLQSFPARVQSTHKGSNYIVRALEVIKYIIRMIRSTSNFVENNGPVLRELPKLYQLAKAFHEIKNNDEHGEQLSDDAVTLETKPKLFI